MTGTVVRNEHLAFWTLLQTSVQEGINWNSG